MNRVGIKKYLIIFFIFNTMSLTANTVMGFLVSDNLENKMIEGYEFEGDNTYSVLIGSKDLFSESFGGYFTIGGTYDHNREEKEENGEIENINKHNIYNVGLAYSPIRSVTLLAGLGQGSSQGHVYEEIGTNKYNNFYTKKDKDINYNLGLNFSGDTFGIIAMYDTYSSVASLGITYQWGGYKYKQKRPSSYKSSPSKIYTFNDLSNQQISTFINRCFSVWNAKGCITNPATMDTAFNGKQGVTVLKLEKYKKLTDTEGLIVFAIKDHGIIFDVTLLVSAKITFNKYTGNMTKFRALNSKSIKYNKSQDMIDSEPAFKVFKKGFDMMIKKRKR